MKCSKCEKDLSGGIDTFSNDNRELLCHSCFHSISYRDVDEMKKRYRELKTELKDLGKKEAKIQNKIINAEMEFDNLENKLYELGVTKKMIYAKELKPSHIRDIFIK